MSKPPTNLKIEPSELFVKLTSTVRPHLIVDIPRKGPDGEPVDKVAMIPLTQAETISASGESLRRARTILNKDLADGMKPYDDSSVTATDVYNNIAACEILFRACKRIDDPEMKRGAFSTPHEIATAFSAAEIGVLYHHYLCTCSTVGPIITEMHDSEIDAWIAVLAEGGTALPLDALSWGAMTSLILSMALRLHNSATDNSSPGSLADQTTETEAFGE